MNASLRRPLGLALVLASVAGALVACQIVAGLEMQTLVDPAVTEAGPAEAGVLDPCSPEVPPPRQAAGGRDVEPVTFAIQFFDISTTVKGDTERLCDSAAIDLDGLDTCGPTGLPDGGTAPIGNSCTPLDDVCDSEGGGDSALQAIATATIGSKPSEEDDPNVQIRAGQLGVLLELTNYNGAPNDQQVSVSLIQSVGVALPDGGLPEPDGGGATPTFDETKDLWVPRAESFFDTTPRYAVTDAYVVSGLLVARFSSPNEPITFGGSATNLFADEVVLTAKIVPDADGRPARLDLGRLALRVPSRSVFDYAAGRLVGGESVCDDTTTGAQLRALVGRLVCSGLDLPGGKSPPRTTKLCDAISYAAGFYATRARRSERTVKSNEDAGAMRTSCPPNIKWPPRCEDYLGDAGP